MDSYRLFTEKNYNIKKIAIIRELSRKTIENHISEAVKYNYPINFSNIMSHNKFNIIKSAINKTKDKSKLANIKAMVPRDISYFDIKNALAIIESKRENELEDLCI